jgi:alkanesulfonate monooxygenase SsuD/methylene tetrahydromethanopterin reductase-like flavin-dependent oxidoreductase (luciferase family)
MSAGAGPALAHFCRRAEEFGVAALWACDHLFWPGPVLECFETLAVAAVATGSVRIGTCVLQLPLRDVGVVAKQAATLQTMSGGRFVLGVGVGSHEGEYAAAGTAFADRGRRLDEGVDALRRIWAGDEPVDAVYRQQPLPGRIPVWVGGTSPRARRRAALRGDGWVPLFITPDSYADALDKLDGELTRVERSADALERAVAVFVAVGPPAEARERGTRWLSSLYGIAPQAFDRHLIAGSAAECAERVQRYWEAGATHVAAMVAGDGALGQFEQLVDALGSTGADRASGVGDVVARRTPAARQLDEPADVLSSSHDSPGERGAAEDVPGGIPVHAAASSVMRGVEE